MRYSTEWARHRRDAERNSQSFASRSGRLFTSLKIEMLSSLPGPIGLRRRHLEVLIGRPVAVVLSGTHVYHCISVVLRLSVSGWKHVSERTTRTNWQKAGPRTVGRSVVWTRRPAAREWMSLTLTLDEARQKTRVPDLVDIRDSRSGAAEVATGESNNHNNNKTNAKIKTREIIMMIMWGFERS